MDGIAGVPATSVWAKRLMECLANGDAAAARYPSDLSAALSLAAKTPSFTVAKTHSRQGAEVAVRARRIWLDAMGCASCGDAPIKEQLAPITWTGASVWPDPHGQAWEYYGTIDQIPFRTLYQSGRWKAELNAC